MNRVKTLVAKIKALPIPRWARSKYALAPFALLLYICLFDQNTLFEVISLRWKLNTIREEKLYNQAKIEEIKKRINELSGDPEKLEKFAREEYYMKRDNEDIYVLVRESDNN